MTHEQHLIQDLINIVRTLTARIEALEARVQVLDDPLARSAQP